MLDSIDLFGQSYHLTFNKKDVFTNSLGGVFTIFTFFITIACIFSLGGEIYYKDSPIVVQKTKFETNRPNYTLRLPFGVIMETMDQGAVDDWQRYVDLKATYIYSDFVPPNDMDLHNESFPMRLCNFTEDFDDTLKDDYEFNELEKALCPGKDLYIGGYWNIKYIKTVEILITECRNTSTKNDCYPESAINKFFDANDKQIGFYFQNLEFNPSSFQDPFNYYLDGKYIKIESSFCKFLDIEVKQVNLSTDYFPIWEMNRYDYEQVLTSLSTDSFVKNPDDLCILKTRLYTSVQTDIITRRYLKLQELFAQLGGLISIFMSVFNQIVHIIYERRMNEQIIRVLFDIDNNEINEEIDRKIKGLPEKKARRNINDKIIIEGDGLRSPKANQTNTKSIIELYNNAKLGESKDVSIDKNLDKSNLEKAKDERNSVERIINADASRDSPGVKPAEGKVDVDIFNPEGYFFSLWDNVLLSFCKCCASKRLFELNQYYLKLLDFSAEYTDVVHLGQCVSQIEKLKYILFSKKQLALFSNRKIDNPLKGSALSDFYKFSRNKEAIDEECNKVFQTLANSPAKKTKIDRKLLDLFKLK